MRNQDGTAVSRRDLLKSAAAGSMALALGGSGEAQAQSAPPSATVSGLVFVETTGGADRTGVPGVLVSNGRDVAVTGTDGRYTLPVSDETIVFVIKPAGYMTPLDPVTNLPQFYYVHQPKGSPASLGLSFDGIAPTGALPASIDFRLSPQDEPRRFDVVLFTDPQPETEAELDFVRDDMMSAIGGIEAKFGMTVGDMMFDDLSLYPRYNRLIGTIGLPWYNVGGNHDLNFEAPDRHYSRETYKRVFGPNYYAFCYADAVFLMLDDVDYLGPDRSKPNNSGKYQGKLDPDQLDFVRNLLANVPDDKLIVIATHIPLRTYLDGEPYQNLTNRDDLFKLLAGRRYTLSLSGHTHTTEHHYFGEPEGWQSPIPHHHQVLTALSGSWWSGPFDHRGVAVADSRDGTPNGFHVLSVDRNACSTRFVPAKEPDGRQIRVTIHSHPHDEMHRDYRPGAQLQPRIALAAVSSTTIAANVFDGGPKTKVTLRIGNAAPIEMAPRAMPDPFVQELYARNDATKKAWVKAEISSHMWTARLPALALGAHPVSVIAVLDDGRSVATRLALEVEG